MFKLDFVVRQLISGLLVHIDHVHGKHNLLGDLCTPSSSAGGLDLVQQQRMQLQQPWSQRSVLGSYNGSVSSSMLPHLQAVCHKRMDGSQAHVLIIRYSHSRTMSVLLCECGYRESCH